MKTAKKWVLILFIIACIVTIIDKTGAEATYTVNFSSCEEAISSDYSLFIYCAYYVGSYSYFPSHISWGS